MTRSFCARPRFGLPWRGLNATFSDAALLLIGHGSSVNADSAAPTLQHGAELRKRRIFADVREAFWKQAPGIRETLAVLSAPRIFAVPLFLSQGYFTEQVIPAELGLSDGSAAPYARVQQIGPRQLSYCQPVGTHESITRLILSRALGVVRTHPFPRAPKPPETTLFLAAHGTGRNEQSRRVVEQHTELIRAQAQYADVHAIFMEEAPRIGDCYELARTKHIVIVPFFLSDGLHANEDIPILLGEPERLVRDRLQKGQPTWRNPTERKGKLVWYSRSLGAEPQLADVILERVREMA